jgi:hypothetical protein
MSPEKAFSEYIVYVDESGDHGMESIGTDYPVFVLVFCIFSKQDYIDCVSPALSRFKMRFWGHDEVVLHEHDIRKPVGPFTILFNKRIRDDFLVRLNALFESIPFTIIASVVNKKMLLNQYTSPANPYDISLSFGLERVYRHRADLGQAANRIPVIVERRGKKEDGELELAFRRICAGTNFLGKELPYELVMIDKKANSAGLQIADLTARPIGIKTLRPQQTNRAYDIILRKLRQSPTGEVKGWGLKMFP